MSPPEFNCVHVFKPRYDEDETISTSSENFSITHDDQCTRWKLKFDPGDDDDVLFNLIQISKSVDDVPSFDIEIHLALVNAAGDALTRWELWRLTGSKLAVNPGNLSVNDGFSIEMSTIDENIDDFCDDDGCLTLKMIVLTKSPEANVKEKKSMKDRSSTTALLDDLKKVYETGENSDVTVRSADGVEMKLHKFILSTRSSTFNKMFNIDMKERETGLVQIKDFEAEVLREMFKFIYFNRVDKLDTIDVELFKAAKRYDIKNLAEICKESMIENINKRNLVELLELAYVYNENELFSHVAQIIYSQYVQIVKTEDWKKLKMEIQIKAYDKLMIQTLKGNTKTLTISED